MYSAAVVQEVLQWRLRAWKMRSVVASYRKLTMPNWETLLKLILLQLHEKLLKNATLTILWSFGIWSKLERWKSSISGCLVRWPKVKKKKKCCFEVSSCLILHNSRKPFLDQIVTCNEKGFYSMIGNDPQWLDREEVPEHFPKPDVHQKRSRSLFGGLLVVWSTPAFWIPVKPLHLSSMLSTSMRRLKTACLQLALVNRKGPVLLPP